MVFGCSDQTARKQDLFAYSNGLEVREAPMLARMVETGKLPSLAERIPETPHWLRKLTLTSTNDLGVTEALGTGSIVIPNLDLGK